MPAPGAPTGRNTSLYPFVGPNYSGEYSGYIYNPYFDNEASIRQGKKPYIRDPKAEQQFYQNMGLAPKPEKAPGLGDLVAPLAAGAAVPAAAKLAGQEIYQAGKGLLGFGGKASTTATTAADLSTIGATALNPATGAVEPVLTNAAGQAVATAVPESGGGLLGFGSYGTEGAAANWLGPVGLAAGGYGLYQAMQEEKPVQGALSGGLAGAGLVGSLALAGVATPLAPIVIGGMLFGGVLSAFGLGDKDMWKVEGDRLDNLQDQGFQLDDIYLAPTKLSGGRSKESLYIPGFDKNFQGWDPDKSGIFVNNKFNTTRSENDLKPWDLMGYSKIIEGIGKDQWNGMNPLQRLEAAINLSEKALASGAVREHHGTIDVDMAKVNASDFQPGKAWEEYKYNTSMGSVKNEVEAGRASSIDAEINRRKKMEPEWTDWEGLRQELKS